MHKSLVVLILLLTTLFSCSKKDDGPAKNSGDAFLTCKMNGTLRKFNFSINIGDKPEEDTVYDMRIWGWEQKDTATSPAFMFYLGLPYPGPGVQKETYVANPNAGNLYAVYFDQNITTQSGYGAGRTAGTSFTLTITSVTKWGIKGNFSGTFQHAGGTEILTVTDGEFSAPYNQ